MVVHFLKEWRDYKIDDIVQLESFYVSLDFNYELVDLLKDLNIVEVIDATEIF